MSGEAFKQYDVVRLKVLREAVHFEPDGTSRRAPQVGDVAVIVEVYKNPPGYELECSGSDGITDWLCAFSANDIEFKKIYPPRDRMRNNHFVGLAIVIFIVYKWLTYGPPKEPMQTTKFLSQTEQALISKDVVGCSVKSNGIYMETCILRVEPDVREINEMLAAHGWVSTSNDRFGEHQTGAWCKGKGTLYAGYDKDGWGSWELVYAENAKDRCIGK